MKNKIFIIILILLLFSCKKETDSPGGSNKIDIGNTNIDSVSYFRARVSTALISTGGNDISQHGHCWSKTEQPTVGDAHSSLGSITNPKTFTSKLEDLEPNTTYFIRAYILTSGSTIYGDQHSLKTINTGKPVVQTGSFYAPDISSAYGVGMAIADSGLAIIQKGFCWSTDPKPSLTNNLGHSEEGPGLGGFADTISGLSEGTDYYVVAYATNEKGTSYGEINGFQTIPITLPTVTTSGITQLTLNSAVSGGMVQCSGNGEIMARGVCWHTISNPSLNNNIGYTVDGTGMGFFESYLTGLNNGTNYYYVAYATNEKGTSFGEIKSFTTPIDYCEGISIVNYGGQNYQTVFIGQQCWIKENLNIGSRINGEQDQSDNGIIEKYCYDDNETNCDEYGGLYQWDEMMQYVTQEGVKGICPEGWHIPTDGEWSDLIDFLGGSSVAGGKMKETGTQHWNSPNAGATNSSGFTALPGGNRSSNSNYYNQGEIGFFWSSSELTETNSWEQKLYSSNANAYRSYNDKAYGFSVRCLKD